MFNIFKGKKNGSGRVKILNPDGSRIQDKLGISDQRAIELQDLVRMNAKNADDFIKGIEVSSEVIENPNELVYICMVIGSDIHEIKTALRDKNMVKNN